METLQFTSVISRTWCPPWNKQLTFFLDGVAQKEKYSFQSSFFRCLMFVSGSGVRMSYIIYVYVYSICMYHLWRFPLKPTNLCLPFCEGYAATNGFGSSYGSTGLTGRGVDMKDAFWHIPRVILLMVQKSCTTWDVQQSVNNGLNYLSAGAGFQPSTVWTW